MKRNIKKILSYLPPVFLDYFEMIFESAAENHIRLVNANLKKYRSYTQLKRQQKKIRMRIIAACSLIFAATFGFIVGPLFFPQPIESELYIPNGKADIVLGNISKNQVTVIFKTLDSANNNKPLATKAVVELYDDAAYSKLARRSNEDDYAVTHVIPVDSLQEGKNYYIKIIAKDSSVPEHTSVVSAWGNGTDPLRVFTTGDLVANCQTNNVATIQNETTGEQQKQVAVLPQETKGKDGALQIDMVKNENYLQPQNKVQTIISWSTNLPASTALIYGNESSQEKIEVPANDQMLTRHQVVLTTLKPETTYYFKVKSVDGQGSTVLSEEYSLRTPRPNETVVQKIEDNFKAIFRQIKPR